MFWNKKGLQMYHDRHVCLVTLCNGTELSEELDPSLISLSYIG